MSRLSIILVNYKVPRFLEQCLLSIRRASVGLEPEVIVVDNASGDDSLEYLSPRFPDVRFLSSEHNLGLAKASNLGFRASKGDMVLFLNPDTILSEDSLSGAIAFLEAHPKAGALGIRMIDGSGRFLPESKRAFPDPATAFYKIIGLAKLFPRSSRFARYHLGHLSCRENHAIDVVSGAFFLVRRSVLERVGLFDEQFFMYGEDIDLSYRIQQAGYTNYYYSGSTILHFKGESTQKQSFRYVKLFYGAMSLFVQKHRLHNGIFTGALRVAIGMRAFISMVRRSIQRIGIPVFDWLLILSVFFLVRMGWSEFIRPDVRYPSDLRLPTSLLTLFFFGVALGGGLLRHPFRWNHFFRATLLASASLLVVYSLLLESYRYSRGMILFGSVFSVAVLALWRRILLALHLLSRTTDTELQFPVLLIGTEKTKREMQQLFPDQPSAAFLQLDPEGTVDTLDHRLNGYYSLIRFTDVVFCTGDLSYSNIFALMERCKKRFSFRFQASKTTAILPLRSE